MAVAGARRHRSGAYMTKHRKIAVAMAGAVVLVIVIVVVVVSLGAYEQSQRSILPIIYPIITQCDGSLTVVLYNGDLFAPISYDLWVYGFNQSSGSATTDPTTHSGNLAAHEHRSFPNQLQCGTLQGRDRFAGSGGRSGSVLLASSRVSCRESDIEIR